MSVTAEISLAALQANYMMLREHVAPAKAAAALKADAYGLGVVPVAIALHAAGCRRFYVYSFEEAVRLRKTLSGKDVRITYFAGPVGTEEIKEAAWKKLTPAVHSEEGLARLHESGIFLPYVLHFDTGMNRYGLPSRHAGVYANEVSAHPPLMIMSHLACADTPTHPMNELQLLRFNAVIERFPGTAASLANSAGCFLDKRYLFDEVRLGAALYGILDDPEATQQLPLAPVVLLSGSVVQVTRHDSPSFVGYGARGRAESGARTATLVGGYADGIPRMAGEGSAGAYTKEGTYCPTLGRVSMDVCTLDVSAAGPDLKPGDTLEWFGRHGLLSDFAEKCGTIGYEILCGMKGRTRKIYV